MHGLTYSSEAWTGRPADAPVPSMAALAKQAKQVAVVVQQQAAIQLAKVPPLKQAALLWIAGDAAMGYFGATPQTGPANEFLVICGIGGVVANGFMFAFGDGRDADKIKTKNRFVRQLNAFGEHNAGYIQLAAMGAMVLGGLLPGGFHQAYNLLQNFSANVQTITSTLDPGILATGLLATFGATLQAFGKEVESPSTFHDLASTLRHKHWHEIKAVAKAISPYNAASKVYHLVNAGLFATGVSYMMSGQHGMNGLIIAAIPALYTAGNIKFGQSKKADMKVKPAALAMN